MHLGREPKPHEPQTISGDGLGHPRPCAVATDHWIRAIETNLQLGVDMVELCVVFYLGAERNNGTQRHYRRNTHALGG